jgi:hypothetical protein
MKGKDMKAIDTKVFSNPRLIELLKKMQEVSRSPAQPYEIKENGSHVIVARRKPNVSQERANKIDASKK